MNEDKVACMMQTIKEATRVRDEKQGLALPAANALVGPRAQWTAPVLHWDLPVSSSDYYLGDYHQRVMMLYDD